MNEACATGSYAAAIAILCQADWLYLNCASKSVQAKLGSLHMRWIEHYANNEVRSFVMFLRNELDRVGPDDAVRARNSF